MNIGKSTPSSEIFCLLIQLEEWKRKYGIPSADEDNWVRAMTIFEFIAYTLQDKETNHEL